MLTRQYWLGETGVFVRSVRTFAQTAIAMIGVSSFSVWSVDWINVLGVSLGAAFISVLMSLDRHAEVSKVAVVEPVVAPTTSGVTPLGFVAGSAAEEPGCGGSLR
jgi:hypothetical protein